MTTSHDLPELLTRLERIKRLTDELNKAQHDAAARSAAIERLGVEIDAVRKAIRPQFYTR